MLPFVESALKDKDFASSVDANSNQLLWQNKMLSEEPPHPKQEPWKYHQLGFLSQYQKIDKSKTKHQISYLHKHVEIHVAGPMAQGIEIKNQLPKGLFCQQLSETDDTTKLKLKSSFENDWIYQNYFSNLLFTLTPNPLVIHLSKDFDPNTTVYVHYMDGDGGNAFMQKQILVLLDEGVTARFIEHLPLSTGSFLNSGIDCFLSAHSFLEVLKIEKGSGRGHHSARYQLARDAQLHLNTLTLGSLWSRHSVYTQMNEPGSETHLKGVYLGQDHDFIDHHTVIDHRSEHTVSSQTYHGVLTDEATAVFNGRIHIQRKAQKSSSQQLNRNLLLSKKAVVNTKPELKIDADDVQATHGATIGQVSPEEEFYLQSRGLSPQVAKQLLCQGFALGLGESLSEAMKSLFHREIASRVKTFFKDEANGI